MEGHQIFILNNTCPHIRAEDHRVFQPFAYMNSKYLHSLLIGFKPDDMLIRPFSTAYPFPEPGGQALHPDPRGMALAVYHLEAVKKIGQAPLPVGVSQQSATDRFPCHKESRHQHKTPVMPDPVVLAKPLKATLPGRLITEEPGNVAAAVSKHVGDKGSPHRRLVARLKQGLHNGIQLQRLGSFKYGHIAAKDAGDAKFCKRLPYSLCLKMAPDNYSYIAGGDWRVTCHPPPLCAFVQQPGYLGRNSQRDHPGGLCDVKTFRRHKQKLQWRIICCPCLQMAAALPASLDLVVLDLFIDKRVALFREYPVEGGEQFRR